MPFDIPLLLYMVGRLRFLLLLMPVLPVFHSLNCFICKVTLKIGKKQRGQNLLQGTSEALGGELIFILIVSAVLLFKSSGLSQFVLVKQ